MKYHKCKKSTECEFVSGGLLQRKTESVWNKTDVEVERMTSTSQRNNYPDRTRNNWKECNGNTLFLYLRSRFYFFNKNVLARETLADRYDSAIIAYNKACDKPSHHAQNLGYYTFTFMFCRKLNDESQTIILTCLT